MGEVKTLRDEFAMAALAGLVRRHASGWSSQEARIAYHYADAMLEARAAISRATGATDE